MAREKSLARFGKVTALSTCQVMIMAITVVFPAYLQEKLDPCQRNNRQERWLKQVKKMGRNMIQAWNRLEELAAHNLAQLPPDTQARLRARIGAEAA